MEAISRDFKENFNKPPGKHTTTHLDNLVKAICSCGMIFGAADRKGSVMYNFTSPIGMDKKLRLQKLPAKLDGIITPATSWTVIKILAGMISLTVYFHIFLQLNLVTLCILTNRILMKFTQNNF